MTDTSSSYPMQLMEKNILLLVHALNDNSRAMLSLAESNHHLAQAMAHDHGDLDDQDPEEVEPVLSMDGQRLT